jgi:hypothetical protein
MKRTSPILFIYLVGFFFVNAWSQSEVNKISELHDLEMGGGGNNFPFSLSFGLWDRLQNAIGAISGLYLFNKLSTLIRERPLTSIIVAIFVGIITDENKENIIAGIKKLRNSVSRVMGFNSKIKKNEQKRGINFINIADLDVAETQKIANKKSCIYHLN